MTFSRFGSIAGAALMTLMTLTLVASTTSIAWSARPDNGANAFAALVAAAKQDGEVVVNGPPLEPVREALTRGFQSRYGINVQYVGGGGAASTARVRAERSAGKYLLDVFVSGPDSPTLSFLPSGWLDKVEPVLVDPSVVDPRVWKDGHVLYLDPNHTIMRLLSNVTPELAINTKLVNAHDFPTWKSLTDPKWQGKIVVKDPTISGSGASLISYFYLTYGPDFVKQLYVGQKPTVTRDQRQAVQWLSQGTYPIVVGPDDVIVAQFQKLGYPIEMIQPPGSPAILSGGWGVVSLLNKAPHPDAAKLFINWLASKEGSTLLAQSTLSVSLRNDVTTAGIPAMEIPKKNGHYVDSYDYTFVTEQRDSAFQKVRELLGL
jgi:iron(III) transport system substrate-binding protein